jgi:hypothetical protein
MEGIWFAVLVAGFMAAGVAVQLGWSPSSIAVPKLAPAAC